MSKGENALALFEDYDRKNIPAPDHLMRPEMPDGYALWYDAFWRLSNDRNHFDGGIGPIPYSSIKAYSEMSEEDFEEFYFIIKSLDKLYLAEYNKETKAVVDGKSRRKTPTKVLDL